MSTATITARNINGKIRPGLSQLMKKKPKDKRVTVTYYLLVGEASKTYEDTLLLLEETLRDGGHADYRFIRDDAVDADMDEEIEIFRLPEKAMIAMLRAMSPSYDEMAAALEKPTYDPAKQYIVDRAKVGRPRRVLSDAERADILRLRAEGLSINDISMSLGINNRRVMECCKNT